MKVIIEREKEGKRASFVWMGIDKCQYYSFPRSDSEILPQSLVSIYIFIYKTLCRSIHPSISNSFPPIYYFFLRGNDCESPGLPLPTLHSLRLLSQPRYNDL